MSFHGSQSESSGDFVQSVARVAFERGRIDDDRWVAQYASTYLNGDALLWYCKLDEETQGSWKKLRSSLLEQFPPRPYTGDSLFHQLSTPLVENDVGKGTPDSRTSTSGVIEVVGGHSNLLGYLCCNGAGALAITSQKHDAAVGTVLQHSSRGAHQILLASQAEAAAPSYVGLAVVKSHSGNPCILSERVEEAEYDSKNYDPPMYYGVPKLSTTCVAYVKEWFGISPSKELAAWTFSVCGESKTAAPYRRSSDTAIPGQRAAAAVWNYGSKTEELRLSWIMDDGGKNLE
ncbi:hypothetical protein FRC01_003541 [Tulasnella sp. 417]|nr:hypothetical protein FRC01_003541 [Tulasnella sp. 417]